MIRLRVWICVVAAAVSVSEASASPDPASRAWNRQRVQMAIDLCVRTAPRFTGFEGAAERAGFHRRDDGTWGFGTTEIVASVKGESGECHCMVSFGSDRRDMAVKMLGDSLLREFQGQFQTDENPRTIGLLSTSEGEAEISAVGKTMYGGDWLGVVVTSQASCA